MSLVREIKVWDIVTRLFHWTLVATFVFTYLAEGEWLTQHIWAGYFLLALLCLRFVWGFVGSAHARFADFVYPPWVVLRYSSEVLTGRAKRHLGHNPAGGAMIVALLASTLFTIWSGIVLYGADAWRGPMAWLMQNASDEGTQALGTLHDFAANSTVVLVVVHVAGVLWESALHRENLVKAMFTGRKRLDDAQN